MLVTVTVQGHSFQMLMPLVLLFIFHNNAYFQLPHVVSLLIVSLRVTPITVLKLFISGFHSPLISFLNTYRLTVIFHDCLNTVI